MFQKEEHSTPAHWIQHKYLQYTAEVKEGEWKNRKAQPPPSISTCLSVHHPLLFMSHEKQPAFPHKLLQYMCLQTQMLHTGEHQSECNVL